jgi:hypothetical protein
MKTMACIIDERTVLQRCLCPVCQAVHFVLDDRSDYFDYLNNGPVVGVYEGWDDALEVVCEACECRAAAVHGRDLIDRLNRSGQIERVEQIARDVFVSMMA